MKSLLCTASHLIWVAIVLAAGGPRAAAQERPGARNVIRQAGSGHWALLIGVDEYTWARKLEFCGADMQALSEQLVASGFPKEQVYLLHDKAVESKYRPTRANIEAHLKLILGLVERDHLIVVGFSGHGVHLRGKSYLCPGDAKLEDPQSLIPVDSVYEMLQQSSAALKLLLVDACRNDPRLDGERSLAPTEGTRQFATSLEQPPRGILLMTSCAPGEIAREEKEFGHGVFMHFLLDGLRGKADEDSSGAVSLIEVYKYANKNTKNYVARKFVDSQRPGLKGDFEDDFDLTQIPGPAKEITNALGMKMVLIQPGELMGTPSSDLKAERPQSPVRITQPFYLGAHEVAQEQWTRLMQTAPWVGKPRVQSGRDFPATFVSWKEAMAFCDRLNAENRSGARPPAGWRYTLPTELQWEYACRARTLTAYCFAETPTELDQYAWFQVNTRDAGHEYAHQIGLKRPNAFGLYDMHGNVWEWCREESAASETQPYRGGSWMYPAELCRATARGYYEPEEAYNDLGFRVALVKTEP